MNVTETPTGDDEGGEGDHIEHDDALDLAGGGRKIRADRRDGHVYDKGIDDEDELRCDDNGEDQPFGGRMVGIRDCHGASLSLEFHGLGWRRKCPLKRPFRRAPDRESR
jgi:hypothetical protein